MTTAADRNDPDYDDWEYGTEPIPGDTTWHAPPATPSPPNTADALEH